MGKPLAYTFVFTVAFIATTGSIIFLNNMFQNIFMMDLTFAKPRVRIVKVDSNNKIIKKGEIVDSTKTEDLVEVSNLEIPEVKRVLDSLKNAHKREIRIVSNKFENKNKEFENLKKQLKEEKEKEYTDWIAKTGKLYESMDSKRVAQLIAEYSDDVAKDLLGTMKKESCGHTF